MRRVLNWGVFALVLVAAWAVAGPTFLGGPASYVIVDGRSMEPTYHDGDLVIAREQASYDVGDIVVYDAPIDSQFNVIHRIVEPTQGGYVTQGDNMDRPDGWIAPDQSIYGSSWLVVPRGGVAIAFLRQPAVAAALAMGLVTFELLRAAERKQAASRAAPEATEAPA